MKGKEKKKEKKKEKSDTSQKQPSDYQREKTKKGETGININSPFR